MNQDTLALTTENESQQVQYISKSLLELGMKPNLIGFAYLKEAIGTTAFSQSFFSSL